MKQIFEEAERLAQKDEPFVIATVIATRGSTPQRVGAKLLIRQDGTAVGTLGGGCVEGEMWHLAKQLLRDQGTAIYREYELKEELSEHGGLLCGGTMRFLIEPFLKPKEFQPLFRRILQAYATGPPVAVLTSVWKPEAKSQTTHKILIEDTEKAKVTLAEAGFSEQIQQTVMETYASGGHLLIESKNGLLIHIEGFIPPPNLVLIGGGHVNKAVANLAAGLGFRIHVVDDRPEFASPERFPEAEKVIISDYEAGFEQIPLDAHSYIVIATRGHRHDDLALAAALRTPACYIGLVGSKRKTILIYKNLSEAGLPAQRLYDIHAPIGLDIGAATPAELAVSIMAEIIMLRRGGKGRSMKMTRAYLKPLLTSQKAQ